MCVVAALGDSLSDPRSSGARYLEPLRAAAPKSRFDAFGVGGDMTNQMRRRLERDVFSAGVAYTDLIVLGGIGDILSNETARRGLRSIQADLGAIYLAAKDRGMRVVALTIPPWGGAREYDPARHALTLSVSAWIRGRPPGVDAVLDLPPLLECDRPHRLCRTYAWLDGLHWNPAGHAVVGEALRDGAFSDCE